jgi:peptide/nickel transport system substrate-binding protein
MINPKSQHKFDLEKSKFHLKGAGMENLWVDFLSADAACKGTMDTATLICKTAAQDGFNVNVVRKAEDANWNNVWM